MEQAIKHDIDFLTESGQLEDLAHYLASYSREEKDNTVEVICYALKKLKEVVTGGGTSKD